MREELADKVYAILSEGLALKERIERGEQPDLRTEQTKLKGLLGSDLEAKRLGPDYSGEYSSASIPAGMRSMADMGPAGRAGAAFMGIRYALACWLDELFVLDDTNWARQWNERKIEASLFTTNDRAWQFWEQAKRAESRSGNDAVEAFYLCVMLGFRGEKRNDPKALQEWLDLARTRIQRAQGKEFQIPPEGEFETAVPPRRGRSRLQTMVVSAALFVLIALPTLVTLVMLKYVRD